MQARGDAMVVEAKAAQLCPGCGYDLRGAASERCPECGLDLSPHAGTASNIPWAYRADLGKRRSYARTVRLAMFHPSRLAAEVARPVRFEDARAFALRTALRAWWPLALLVTWLYAASLK